MDSKDFPTIFNYFSDKIDLINELIPLVKASNLEHYNHFQNETIESLPKLNDLTAIVQEMEEMLSIVDIELDRQKGDLLAKKEEVLKKIDLVRNHCNHLSEYKGRYQAARAERKETKLHTNKPGSKIVKKDEPRTKKTVVSEPKPKPAEFKMPKNRDIPLIDPINKEEFDEIPQYMKGRITHQSLNQGLASFMSTIAAKYQLLATHSSRYSEEEMKRAQMYKSQENAETAGQLFCTTDDLKMYSNLKETNTTKIVLTCLRHCKRVKEIRGPGKLIRYAVVKP